MKLLKDRGYREYRPPQTSEADQLFQRRVEVDVTEQDMYLNAYVYDSVRYQNGSTVPKTVEFWFQLDRENEKSIRIKLFNFTADELSGRDIEDIEDKARNLFIYSHYV